MIFIFNRSNFQPLLNIERVSFILILFHVSISLLFFPDCVQAQKNEQPHKLRLIEDVRLPDDVFETSGLIYFNGNLVTINDGGNKPELIFLDTLGKLVKKVELIKSVNNDWEALAQDSSAIFIGDVGNNHGNRKNLNVISISKLDLNKDSNLVFPQNIGYSYTNQNDFSAKPYSTIYDCESMVSVDDTIYLFSKNWVDKITYIYSLYKKSHENNLKSIDSISLKCMVTDAAYDELSSKLYLIGYRLTFLGIKSYIYSMRWDVLHHHFSQISCYKLPFFLRQTEGITLKDENTLYITCEGLKWKFIRIHPKMSILKLN